MSDEVILFSVMTSFFLSIIFVWFGIFVIFVCGCVFVASILLVVILISLAVAWPLITDFEYEIFELLVAGFVETVEVVEVYFIYNLKHESFYNDCREHVIIYLKKSLHYSSYIEINNL